MKQTTVSLSARLLLPLAILLAAVLMWVGLAALHVFPESAFPYPTAVVRGLMEEMRSGRLFADIVASLFRTATGFGLSVILGIPFGLWLGLSARARFAWLPSINFFRSLSPIAWIPFAILWFGIGDVPVIFLVFMATFFPLVLSVADAVTRIPAVYFKVARDHGLGGVELLTRVTFPAILPQLITALRVTAGMAWLVLVAAEMIAGREGLGFAIHDARNGLRTDLVVVGMAVIGSIGVVLDHLLRSLTRIPSVRWGYER
jgi:NitT/TauT family transport system permease protein